MAACAAAPARAIADVAAPADFTPGGPAKVVGVLDDGALALADGRRVVLVDIEVPTAQTRGAHGLAAQARATLGHLIGAGDIELRYAGAPRDRYGRVLAQVFAAGRWLQGALLEDGLARVHGRADARIGLPQMLAIENAARRARRGLWARRAFAVRAPDALAGAAGTFEIVAGTVVATAAVDGAVYVNFGADWHTAFSLRIAGDALKECRAAGLDPVKLTGASLRVRGFVEGGRRPLIEILFPEQIERLPVP